MPYTATSVRKLSLRLLSFILLAGSAVNAQQYHFSVEHITKKDGLSNSEITSIVQDKQGFIWIGTQYGLNKFDGYTVKVYQNIPGDSTSICDNNITALLVDSHGYLWIGTANNGISVYDRIKDRFVHFTEDLFNLNSLSDNYITSIREDKLGNVWVGTLMGLNKFQRESQTFKRYFRKSEITVDQTALSKLQTAGLSPGVLKHLARSVNVRKDFTQFCQEVSSLLPQQSRRSQMAKVLQHACKHRSGINIKAIEIDPHNNLWLGFEHDSIAKFNVRSQKLDIIEINNGSLNSVMILSLCLDDDKLWIGTKGGGLVRYNLTTQKFYNYKKGFGSEFIKCILRDREGQLWVGTEDGLKTYNRESDSFHVVAPMEYDDKLLSSDVSAMLEDIQGNFWVASYQGGINLLKKDKPFAHDKFYDGSKSVSAVLEDSDNNLWVGYFTSGIDLFLNDGRKKISLTSTPACNLGKGTVFSIFEDSKKNIWVSTYEGGLQRYDKERRQFVSYPFRGDKSINDVRAICEDRQGNIWVAVHGDGVGKLSLQDKTKTFFFYKADYVHTENSLANNWVNTVFCDAGGRIWAGTVNGISVYDSMRHHFITYNTGNSGLSHNKVLTLTQDQSKRLWVGTENGLNLFDEHNKTFKVFTTNDGLSSNFIAGLRVDAHGDLWISTYNGLSCLDPVTGRIKNYLNTNGPMASEFSIGATAAGKNDKMYFGAKSGLIYFYPGKINRNLLPPTVIITDFKLFNKSVPVSNDEHGLLTKHISENKKITLPYNQNDISFEFTAINYIDSKQNTYAYWLEGFEKTWNYVGTHRTATYTNLDAGTYTLHVLAANNDGVMATHEASLEIVIKPPFWLTTWAKMIYVLLILVIIYVARKEFISRMQLKNKVDLDEMKLRFFANISHELRTPLTLILAPLQQLNTKISKEDQAELIGIMDSNGRRLLRLVNQLMNIYEIDAGVMKLQVSQGDVVALCRATFNTFRYNATKRNVTYEFKASPAEITGFVDADKVDKILSNIISNAFKYSPENSSIRVQLSLLDKYDLGMVPLNLIKAVNDNTRFLKISVQDTGKGIPVEYHKKVFERFFRMEDSLDTATGIGLSLARQLARIHKGDITIDSKVQKGSTFIIWLPMDKTSYSTEEIETAPPNDQNLVAQHAGINDEEEYTPEVSADQKSEQSLPILMVIEDSEDIRIYIRHFFKEDFQVVEAASGEAGLEIVTDIIPDILICDVMLPGLSGLEVCARVKKDQKTSHIPVILLTARATDTDQLRGLAEGADDYITKPFNISILAARIRNIMAYRKKLTMTLQLDLYARPQGAISSADDLFLKKAVDVVETHIEDVDLSVETLCLELGMSPSNLYRKLQALVGLSANQFINNIRLKKATHLLKSGQYTISEIAYRVGFRDPKYFSKSFRKQFGVLPSYYGKSTELSAKTGTEKISEH